MLPELLDALPAWLRRWILHKIGVTEAAIHELFCDECEDQWLSPKPD